MDADEIGQPYRTELLEYGTTMKEPAYLAINPMGKVPAIRHGDTVVTEAAAICAYLPDAFPEARLVRPLRDRLRRDEQDPDPRDRLEQQSRQCERSGDWRRVFDLSRNWMAV
jgi:glutathione S-transferase